MSIAGEISNIKIWNINNFELLLNIEKINIDGYISSSCFLNDFNQNYILTSDSTEISNPESIKVFDFSGNQIKEIEDSKKETFFIDTYYEENNHKIYIITGNDGYIQVYDYNNNKLMQKYCDNSNKCHNSIIIYKKDLKTKIIESSEDGKIRIWNFHSGKLLQKIQVSNNALYGICLWDEEYIFVGCNDNSIKLVELSTSKIINSLEGHNEIVLTVKKINHPQYGDCLLSQGFKESNLILWSNKSKFNEK